MTLDFNIQIGASREVGRVGSRGRREEGSVEEESVSATSYTKLGAPCDPHGAAYANASDA